MHDRASNRWWAWSDTTLSAPSQTLSAPPARPCNPPVHPVPATDSPAPDTCPYRAIQSHNPRNGCPSHSAASGGLGSARSSADWMPDPSHQKEMTPYPSQKKNPCQIRSKTPFGGIAPPAQRGTHHITRPQKRVHWCRGLQKTVRSPAARRAQVQVSTGHARLLSPVTAVNGTAGKVPRSLERGRLLSTQEINMELADFCLVQSALHMRR